MSAGVGTCSVEIECVEGRCEKEESQRAGSSDGALLGGADDEGEPANGGGEPPGRRSYSKACAHAEPLAERQSLQAPLPVQVPAAAAGRWPWRNGGLVSFSADLSLPLMGPPLRTGEVWHLQVTKGTSRFSQAILSLHTNGFSLSRLPKGASSLSESEEEEEPLTFAWSPFALVQACRLHSAEADGEASAWTRIFKVSLFQQSSTHFFAVRGAEPELERARWVAALSGALRRLTQLFFPPAVLRTEPLQGASWTATRLLASYTLLCKGGAVLLVYCELHAHCDGEALLVAYDDELCNTKVAQVRITHRTVICERVGVDCSCFTLDTHDFSARTAAEKRIWLRAISNLKVKLRNQAANPTPSELRHYRAAILEHAVRARAIDPRGFSRAPRVEGQLPRGTLLPPNGHSNSRAHWGGSAPLQGRHVPGPPPRPPDWLLLPRAGDLPPPLDEGAAGRAAAAFCSSGGEPDLGAENGARWRPPLRGQPPDPSPDGDRLVVCL